MGYRVFRVLNREKRQTSTAISTGWRYRHCKSDDIVVFNCATSNDFRKLAMSPTLSIGKIFELLNPPFVARTTINSTTSYGFGNLEKF